MVNKYWNCLTTSANSTGYVIVDPHNCEGRVEILRKITIHELGHGYGAAHLLEITVNTRIPAWITSDSSQYYMTNINCNHPYESGPIIDEGNRQRIKIFVENTRELPEEGILELRARSITEMKPLSEFECR